MHKPDKIAMPPSDFNCPCAVVDLTRFDRWWLQVRSVRLSMGLSRSSHRPIWPDVRIVRTRGALNDDAVVALWLWFGGQLSWTKF